MVTSRECDDNFAIRAFFIVAFNLLLFINTDSYIRVADAKWTENLDVIDGINWCKALIDNLRFSARLWRNERDKKEHANIKKIAINGCGIFLNVSYLFHFLCPSFFCLTFCPSFLLVANVHSIFETFSMCRYYILITCSMCRY
ncbi:hypothetical protein GQ55_8G143400 [Panicum hallii var. hallii]|uniref:Uncharacterized protein n=1 Tax=Panicum hallii var. hallii TaxID=1504633 RepID=A0A2T7CN47_9POAL|nr:hypothetical protein GQ55_8G143400 [Panicum hallii var. hallii]